MNISLIGMMGCGKSTIGKLLAQYFTDFKLIDTDEMIVKSESKDINTIFALKGENYFRDLETQILLKILKNDSQIISTGGGIIKSEANRKLLKENSLVIYLKADAATLFKRVKNNKERPLLNVENMQEKINILLNERTKFYEEAHIVIDTTNKNIDIIQKEIVEKINKYGKS